MSSIKKLRIIFPLIVLFLVNSLAAQITGVTGDSLPVSIGPYDTNIQLAGRFDMADKNGPRCAWTGSSIIVSFKGKAINIILDGQKNYFNVIVDDSVRNALETQAGRQRYRLVSGLKDTVHVVTLFRRSEAFIGVSQLFGFELEAKRKLLPLPPPPLPQRKMEMVGNSITCGYGNEAPNEKTKFIPAQENGYLAYGAVTARNLKAEYRAIAWSGKGMCRNIDLTKTERMPELFERTIPQDTASRWDFTKWVPDVVVINLGTNDFNRGNPSEEEFIGAYRAFIQKLRVRYPQAHVFCAVGSMMSDDWPKGNQALTTTRNYLTRMVEAFRQAGDKNVHYVEMDPQNGELNGVGTNYHPTIKTNQLMANQLTEAIKKAMGW